MQDPSTGELHPVGDPPLDTDAGVQKARDLKWLEFRMDEVLTIKGKDFRVKWIGKNAILVEPVITVPSALDALNELAAKTDKLAALAGWPKARKG